MSGIKTNAIKIRRALFTVTDKSNLVSLAQAMAQTGTEIVATGKTAEVLIAAGITVIPIEKISGSPEAFNGRMKTLSFPVCSGILYRRDSSADEQDLKKLSIQPIDCVVVNFYPFEKTVALLKNNLKESLKNNQKNNNELSSKDLVEVIDIGGPTLVRSAAKNAPSTLVLTDPAQYERTIQELQSTGRVSEDWSLRCAQEAWVRIADYDDAIVAEMGLRRVLKYGENPHQTGRLVYRPESPLDWENLAAGAELSYNNILDLTAAYRLSAELKQLHPESCSVVIVKHNNPCGVAVVPIAAGQDVAKTQLVALEKAWQGDPVSAFGGVLVFSHPLGESAAAFLAERFVEVIAAPELSRDSATLARVLAKRKNLRAVSIRRFETESRALRVSVIGGELIQDPDVTLDDPIEAVTGTAWSESKKKLSRFGISVCRALKSNSLAIVRECPDLTGAFQLVGAGQGQPNRVEALKWLAVPRAKAVLKETGGELSQCVLVSDAFFPFRDTVEEAYAAGVRWIVQPGGSIKDKDSIAACQELGVQMAFTGRRHFRH